jgi:hypothetical protein
MTPDSRPMTNVKQNASTTPEPQRRQPAENLDAGGHRDRHARGSEEALAEARQTGREDVVHPEPESEHAGRDQGKNQREIAERRPPAETDDDRGTIPTAGRAVRR